MPLYISNTSRVETIDGNRRQGINSTTTTTLVPPADGWGFIVTGDGTGPQTQFEITYVKNGNPLDAIYDASQSLYPNGVGIDYGSNVTVYPNGDTYISPMSVQFEVTPSIFGKVTTFQNTTSHYKLASYVPYSSSVMIYEMVPASSSIQRCVTYPAYTFFADPLSGSNWNIPVGPEVFGADCQYDIYPECNLVYNDPNGETAIFSGSAPCQSGGTTTTTSTTTSTTTTSTTTTSTTTTSTTTPSAPTTYQVEYLIVAGGGAGGPATATGLTGTGGGGAGGFISSSIFVTASQAYSFVVGNGGSGVEPDFLIGNPGQNSTAFGFTAISGSGGASQSGPAFNGGSGGGGASRGASTPTQAFGSGSGTQGNNGGNATQATNGAGGGGGGALTAGSTPGAGNFEGGGLGKLWLDGNTYAAGGNAKGAGTGTQAAVNATANTGNGGGGIKTNTTVTAGGNGGSGIVVLRYPSGSASGSGGTIVNAGGYTYHYFTGSGTYTA